MAGHLTKRKPPSEFKSLIHALRSKRVKRLFKSMEDAIALAQPHQTNLCFPLASDYVVTPIDNHPRFKWRIHALPIFAEHSRKWNEGVFHVDREWMLIAAFRMNRASNRDTYISAAHTEHHPNPGMSGMAKNERLGFLEKYSLKQCLLEGKPRWVLFSDVLVETDAQLKRIEKLPFRSVEIADLDDPWIGSIAFMETEEPWFHFPHPTYRVNNETRTMLHHFAAIAYREPDKRSHVVLYRANTKLRYEQMEDEKDEKDDVKAQAGEAESGTALLDMLMEKLGPMIDQAIKDAMEQMDMGPMVAAAVEARMKSLSASDGPSSDPDEAAKPFQDDEEDETPEDEKRPVAASRGAAALSAQVQALLYRINDLETQRKGTDLKTWAREQLRNYPAGQNISDKELDTWARKGRGSLESFVSNFKRFSKKTSQAADVGINPQGERVTKPDGTSAGIMTAGQAQTHDRLLAMYNSNPQWKSRFNFETFKKHNSKFLNVNGN